MAILRTKPGVEFAVIDDVTRQLFYVLLRAAEYFQLGELTITSGSDGVHSGPDDPHYCGHAVDVRTHDLPPTVDAGRLVLFVKHGLGDDYFAFFEANGTPNAHLHVQLAKGHKLPTSFPEPDAPAPA